MNCKTIFKYILLTVFVSSMGLMLCPNSTAAFSLKSADIDHIVHSKTDYKINSIFMEIYPRKGYVVVGEIAMYLMDFASGGKDYRTVFVNENGETSYAASVKASKWVRKRVLVKGYRLDSGNIVVQSIQKVKLRHK